MDIAYVDIMGDRLEVAWDGNVWVAPSCGAQFSRSGDALAVEVTAYLRASGEVIDDGLSGDDIRDHYEIVKNIEELLIQDALGQTF